MNFIPYTYLLKCPNGKYYYGVKYANNKQQVANPSTFWVKYFTSSKEVKKLIKIYGKESFSFEIRKTFKTQKEAILWEGKVNKRLTTKSEKFLNDSYLDGRVQKGTRNGNYGKRKTEEQKRKAVDARRLNNNGKYGGSRNTDFMKTAEWKSMLSERSISLHKQGKFNHMFVVDKQHIYDEYDKFIFPVEESAYKTRGSRMSKITYFVNMYYLPNFSHMIKSSKNPYATVRRCLIKRNNNDPK